MRMIKDGSRKRKLVLLCCGLGIVSSSMTQMGMAATETNATFVAHYEHRAQIAAELMAIGQPLPANSEAGAADIQSAVTRLDQEVAMLYTVDQALAEQADGISSSTTGATKTAPMNPMVIALNVHAILRDAKSGMTDEVKAYTNAVKHPGTRGKAWSKRLSEQVKSARTAVNNIAKTTKTVNKIIRRPAFRNTPSLQMQVLQAAIEQAQGNVIDLLIASLWLNDKAWVNEQPTSATGLAYATSTLSIPGESQAAATDVVQMQPLVTDAAGQSLPDWGTYHLQASVGHSGIDVDPLLGTVTVHPGATPGAYSIVYTQGNAVERTVIQVVASSGTSSRKSGP